MTAPDVIAETLVSAISIHHSSWANHNEETDETSRMILDYWTGTSECHIEHCTEIHGSRAQSTWDDEHNWRWSDGRISDTILIFVSLGEREGDVMIWPRLIFAPIARKPLAELAGRKLRSSESRLSWVLILACPPLLLLPDSSVARSIRRLADYQY